jgi:hypothetical protein
MNGGEISGNTGSVSGNGYGGGVFVAPNGTFTMYDGEISGNTGSVSGGGVYVYETFTMNGGEISGNTASYGGGVYVPEDGTFTMSGTARVIPGPGHHVFLSYFFSYPSFTIGGDFTGDSGPIAVIDLSGDTINDWLGKNVLKTNPEGGTIGQSLIDRFTLGSFITYYGSSTPLTGYKIDTDGTLVVQ